MFWDAFNELKVAAIMTLSIVDAILWGRGEDVITVAKSSRKVERLPVKASSIFWGILALHEFSVLTRLVHPAVSAKEGC